MALIVNKFGKGSFDSADSSFQGLGNLQSTYEWGSGIPGCTDPTAFNYNANATVDDGSCIAAVYGCMDVTAENYDCECSAVSPFPVGGCGDGVNISNQYCCIIIGCTDPAYAEYNPNATQPDPSMCITLISYGCTDTSTMNIGDGQPNDYNVHTNAATFTNPCNGTFNPCVVDAYGQMQTGTNCCCIDTIVGCTNASATNYDPLANTTPQSGSTLECQFPNLGCTDPQAFNYDPSADQDDGSCLYYGCTDPTATNYGWGPSNGNVWTVSATGDTYVNVNAPITYGYTSGSAFDDGSCIVIPIVTGCMDPLATNYNSNVTVDDGTCIYIGCSYLQTSWLLQPTATAGYTLEPTFVSGWGVNTQNHILLESIVPSPGVHPDWMGTPLIQSVNFTDDGSCVFYGCADDGSCTVPTCGYNSPYPGIPASNYNPPTTNDAWPGSGIVDDGSCSYTNFGCMDVTVGDNPDINGDCTNGTNVGYPNLGACGLNNGYLAENYDPAALTNFGCLYSSSVIPGCTDPMAYNYDPNANFNNGTCCYTNTGCTDPNANNFDPCATIACASCCTYDGCPASVVAAQNAGCSSFYEAGSTTPCSTYNITVNDGSCIIPPPVFVGCYVPDDNLKRALHYNFNNQILGYNVQATIDWTDFVDATGTSSATDWLTVPSHDYIDVTKLDTGAVASIIDVSEYGISDPTGLECLGGNIEVLVFNKTEPYYKPPFPGQLPYGQNSDWTSWKFLWDMPNDNSLMSGNQPGITFVPSYGTKQLEMHGTNIGVDDKFSMYEYNALHPNAALVGTEAYPVRIPMGDAFPDLEIFFCNECHLGGVLDTTSGFVTGGNLLTRSPSNEDAIRFFHYNDNPADFFYDITHINTYNEAIRPVDNVAASPMRTFRVNLNPNWKPQGIEAPGNGSSSPPNNGAGNFPALRVLEMQGMSGGLGQNDAFQVTSGSNLIVLDVSGTETGISGGAPNYGNFDWTASSQLERLTISNTPLVGLIPPLVPPPIDLSGMPNIYKFHALNYPLTIAYPQLGAHYLGAYGQYGHTASNGWFNLREIDLSAHSSNFLNNPAGLSRPVQIMGPGISAIGAYDPADYPYYTPPFSPTSELLEIKVAAADQVAFHAAYGGDGTYPFVGTATTTFPVVGFDNGIEITS
tara:strand:- start:2738 stop:6166 length:3429 start_codon:yes stop_codon:yes gene_type:complete